MPRRSGFPQGSGEVLERDRGSKSPVSFQPPPRGANKIYTYDVVFLIEKSKINAQSKTPIPYKITKNISRLQVIPPTTRHFFTNYIRHYYQQTLAIPGFFLYTIIEKQDGTSKITTQGEKHMRYGMKNILAMLLAAILLVGCGAGTETDTKGADNAAGTNTETETESVVETEEPFGVEKADYSGAQVNILLAGNWSFDDFIAEELTGEAIKDARFNVNKATEDLLNVTIRVDNQSGAASGGTGTGYKLFDNMVMAGSSDYDFGSIGCYDVCTLSYNGRLLDLNKMASIDLNRSWWDPKANEHLSIRGKMFFSTGDIQILDNDCTYCFLFNKQVVEDFALENPYELVANNQWTFDKFYEMGNSVASDLNGDGKKDLQDRYGVLIWQDSVIGMLHSSGGKCATIDEKGHINLTLNTETNVDVLTRWLTMNTEPMAYFLGGATDDEVHSIFTENRCLFYTRYLKAASWFRDMDTDFGILPYPKWDATQQDYCNTMHAYGTSYISVPITTADQARTGAVIESLAYYGQKQLTPAYYETTLKGKYFRDEESAAMLDLIFKSRFFDIGMYYQFGGYNEMVITMMQQKKTDFVSMYEKKEAKALEKIAEVNAAYDAME